MRLFAATTPPPGVLDHLGRALEVASSPATAGRSGGPVDWRADPLWTARENLHLTLAFYGDVPQGGIPDLVGALGEVSRRTPPLDLELRGAGTFMGRVLWMGVGGDVDALRRLSADCLGASVRPAPDGDRPARPHLTVARARRDSARSAGGHRGRRQRNRPGEPGRGRGPGPTLGPSAISPLEALARALAVYSGPSWTADRFSLIESRPGQGAHGGPLYRLLETWEMGAR